MRAVLAENLGPPETFSLAEAPPPRDPKPDEVRVAIHAAGVSFVDVLVAQGKYQLKPPVPFTPGSEFAGVADAVGSAVTAVKPGDRVCGSSFGGALAEAVTVRAAALAPIPTARAFAEAAVFRVSYETAYHALVQRGALAVGETLLVLGAGGAVGAACVQLGKVLGARVIASASTDAKRTLAKAAGADEVLDSASAEWRNELKALTGGRGVDVVADPVGGRFTEPAFRSLAWNGRHLVIGFVAGIPALPANLALLKGAALVGVDLRQFVERERLVAAENTAAVMRLFEEGRLVPAIGRTYALEEFAAAMNDAASGATAGRIVIRVR